MLISSIENLWLERHEAEAKAELRRLQNSLAGLISVAGCARDARGRFVDRVPVPESYLEFLRSRTS
jgi:hypothetical protein